MMRKGMILLLLAMVLLAGAANASQTVTICNSGCTYTKLAAAMAGATYDQYTIFSITQVNSYYELLPRETYTYYGYSAAPTTTVILFNANNITVNCNGSTIKSLVPNSNTAFNTNSKNNITIKNCNVTNFVYGYVLYYGSDNKIIDSRAVANQNTAIYETQTANLNIINFTAENSNGYGYYTTPSSGTATNNKIINSRFIKNAVGLLLAQSKYTIMNSDINQSMSSAINLAGSVTDIIITNNTIYGGAAGIIVSSGDQRINITYNRIYNNSGYAISTPFSSYVNIKRNSIFNNSRTSYQISLSGSCPGASAPFNMTGNYWGKAVLPLFSCGGTGAGNDTNICSSTYPCGNDTRPYSCENNWNGVEICNNLDDDCNGIIDDAYNNDLDAYSLCGTPADCNDNNANIYPGAPEICNGINDDCDAETDEGCDDDSDGYADSAITCTGSFIDGNGNTKSCSIYGGISKGDCNDNDNVIYTGALEVCDSKDNNCANGVDEDSALGTTPCGLGACAHTQQNCVDGEIKTCDPMQGSSAETCNGINDDCDAETDEGLTPPDASKTAGECNGQKKTCAGTGGWIDPNFALIQTYQAVETSCDGLDNDCDGTPDNGLIAPLADKQEGVCVSSLKVCGHSAGWIEPNYNSLYPNTYQANMETRCDRLDNNCDGTVDNANGGMSVESSKCRCFGGAEPMKDASGSPMELLNGIDDNCNNIPDSQEQFISQPLTKTVIKFNMETPMMNTIWVDLTSNLRIR